MTSFSCSIGKTGSRQRRRQGCRPITDDLYERVSIEDDCSVSEGFGTLYLAHLNGGLTLIFLRDRELNAVAFGQTAESLRDD